MVAFGQALVPLIANPLFGLVYRATLSTYPGTYLLIICGLLVFALGSSIYLYVQDVRRKRNENTERTEEISQTEEKFEVKKD